MEMKGKAVTQTEYSLGPMVSAYITDPPALRLGSSEENCPMI
jgi:hypothetical protein